MAPKDKTPTSPSKAEKQLTAQVKALRTRVKTLEAEVGTWRKRAEKQSSKLQKVREQAEKAIAEATALAKKRARAKADKRIQQAIADHQRDERPRAEPLALKDAPALPEASWTVAQLRVAAREQGVPGYSRLRKDQLLAALL
ncbi:MAG: Rho termination factor N-terminal domain-containing protein [Aeromicrobium sp.]